MLLASIGILQRLLHGLYFVLSLGFSAVVFVTMTWYMLSSRRDALSQIIYTIAPRAKEETVARARDTIEAVLLVPMSAAARNAAATLLIYRIFVVPYAHIAALAVVVFTLFPLTYAYFACLPWSVVLAVSGHWLTGMFLLLFMAVSFEFKSEAERRREQQVGRESPRALERDWLLTCWGGHHSPKCLRVHSSPSSLLSPFHRLVSATT